MPREAGGGNELLGCFRIALVAAAEPIVVDNSRMEFQQRRSISGRTWVMFSGVSHQSMA